MYAPISPLRKRGVEYWKSFPLSSVENIRKWEQDCHALRRARANNNNNVSHYDDSSLSSSAPSKRLKRSEEAESSSSDLGGRREEVDNNTSPSFDDRSPTTEPPPHHHHDSGFVSHMHRSYRSPQQHQQINVDALHVSPPAEEDLSSEDLHSASTTTAAAYGRHSQQHGRPLSEDYYVVDHNTLSQLAFLKGGGSGVSSSSNGAGGGAAASSSFALSAPPAPQELSSWDAAPPIKFQQQFLW